MFARISLCMLTWHLPLLWSQPSKYRYTYYNWTSDTIKLSNHLPYLAANCITNSFSVSKTLTLTRLCPAGQLALTEVDSCASTDDCPTNSFCQIYDQVCCTTIDGCPVDEPTDLTPCTSVGTCSYGTGCSDGGCLPEKVKLVYYISYHRDHACKLVTKYLAS